MIKVTIYYGVDEDNIPIEETIISVFGIPIYCKYIVKDYPNNSDIKIKGFAEMCNN